MKFKIKGVIAAMVTPFTKNGDQVDFEKVGPLVDYFVKQGIHGLFPCGTTGEGMLMSPDERMNMLEEVVRAAKKKVTVIAHTGALDTPTSIALTRHAQEAGADAAAVVAPGYYAYDDQSLAQFYKSIAKACPDFPVLLYNIPGCARNALSADLILRLAEEVPNIVGIKDSSGSMPLLTRLFGAAPKDFTIVNGTDDYAFQAFASGGTSAVSGPANAVPDLYLGVYNEFMKGRMQSAWRYQVRLENAARIFQYGRLVAAFKEGMRLRGIDPGHVRPPQRELSAAEKKALAKALETAGIL